MIAQAEDRGAAGHACVHTAPLTLGEKSIFHTVSAEAMGQCTCDHDCLCSIRGSYSRAYDEEEYVTAIFRVGK
jgi:hypothetical protein